MKNLERFPQEDRGFTLVELLVYSALLGLVMVIVASILVSGVTNQARVTQSGQSTSQAQQAMVSLGNGVRNATALNSPTASSPLLVVDTTTRSSAASTVCQAWYYSSAEKSIRTKTAPATGTKISIPTASQLTGWDLVASNVSPVTTGASIFQVSGASVTASFSVTTNRGAKQTLTSTFSSRQPIPGSGQLCF